MRKCDKCNKEATAWIEITPLLYNIIYKDLCEFHRTELIKWFNQE